MFDHVFMRIINAEDIETVDAIKYAIDKIDSLTEKQRSELHIIANMQKQIFILTAISDLQEQRAEGYKEYASSAKEVIDMVDKEFLKVKVAPIQNCAE